MPTFVTKDANGQEKTWTYSGPKQGGANSAGPHGGFYQYELEGQTYRCLIKQDARTPLNIAEFLGGRIYKAMIPEVSAELKLVRVDDNDTISADGSNVYLVSEFIPDWKHDLYTEIQLSLNRNPKHSNFKFKEVLEIAQQLIFSPYELNQFFEKKQQQGDLLNFGQVSVTSLLINNIDINLGNLGIIDKLDRSPKRLGVIDYGAAFRDMTDKINPHSFKKYISTHTFNREGWNNFLFYPESIKITPEFVSELDKASNIDLTNTVEDAFNDISAFYGIKPIVDFAVRAGVSESFTRDYYIQLESNPELAGKKTTQIKDAILAALKKRQADLSRFSAQIKMDMCVQHEPSSKRYNLDGSFLTAANETKTFNDVVWDHFDYFKEITLRTEPFKFRKATHKYQPRLIEAFHKKSLIICASLLLDEKNKDIQEPYQIQTMDEAINVLQQGLLDKVALDLIWDKGSIPSAKKRLAAYQSEKDKNTFDQVKKIINELDLSLDESTQVYSPLENNKKLQSAIIELDKGCSKLALDFTSKETDALLEYKKETISLALKGPQAFKDGYAAIEAKVIRDIDHDSLIKFARYIGNLIVIALATASLVGLYGLYYTRESRGGILLFNGPEREVSEISSRFDDLYPRNSM